jgi:alpha-beta hydrolase superfamily lysophospholipase
MQSDGDNRTAARLAPDRRTVLSGLGLAAAAAAAPGASRAASKMVEPSTAGGFWTKSYTAKKGSDITLALYRKRLHAPKAGEKPLPVLMLVHGSSISALPSWDLHVPGAGEYSIMDVFSRYGYDVWTMDFEGYGRSTVTASNSNIKDGVADLEAVAPLIEAETGQKQFLMMGESSGAIRTAAFAAANPDRAARIILSAYTYTGKGSRTLKDRAKQEEFYRTHNRRPRPRSMIESIFTRDKPGTSDQRVATALANAELPYGDSVPTGTYLDMVANLPIVDPKEVKCPVLMTHGQYDGIATEEDLLDFFRQLPTSDRQVAILPGLAHSLVLGLNRQCFWHVANEFLSMPRAQVV